MRRIALLSILIFGCSAQARSKNADKPVAVDPPADRKLPAGVKLIKLDDGIKNIATEAENIRVKTDMELQKIITDFNTRNKKRVERMNEILKILGIPDGSQFTIDEEHQELVFMPPQQQPEPPKADEKKAPAKTDK